MLVLVLAEPAALPLISAFGWSAADGHFKSCTRLCGVRSSVPVHKSQSLSKLPLLSTLIAEIWLSSKETLQDFKNGVNVQE